MSKPGPLELLRTNADFRRLWFAQLISFGGDWFNSVALVGLVLALTGSSFTAALVLAADRAPHFFVSPISGVVADRLDRRRLMIAADLVRAVLALGMLLVRSPDTVWIGIACAIGLATFSAFFFPASQAALPNLVTPAQLAPANVLMGASFGTMLAVGAALGGLVATYLGRDTAFVLNSATFLASAALVARVRGPFSSGSRSAAPVRPVRDVLEGIRYAGSDGRVVALLATKAGFGLGAGVIVLLSVFAVRVFDAGDAGIGLLFAARGLGALLGPFAARAFVRDDQRRLFLAIGVSMTVFGIAYSVFPALGSLWAAAAAVTIAHLGAGGQWVMSSYGLQRLVADHVRGRIFSFDFALVTLSISVSFLAAGRAAEAFDPRAVMYVLSGIALVYAAVWTIATRRFWTRGAEEPPGPAEPPFPVEDLPLVTD